MRPIFQNLLLAALIALLVVAPARAADRLRLALQKTGSGVWELAVITAFGLDKQAGLELAVTELANTDAAKIAIQSGSVDIVVSDWLWVARQRAAGATLTFYPHSTAIGSLMARDRSVRNVADLAGKKIGVAGGPLDKSWLMLRAYAQRSGIDLEKAATIVYGAPPLIAEKTADGELDAALEFWNFAADLEARGLFRVLDLRKVETALGAKGAPVVTGYVFDEGFAAKNREPLARFFAMIDKARSLIATSDAAWRVAMQRIPVKDPSVLALYRESYAEGIPTRSIGEERADAALLYATLAEIGGPALVGRAKTLPAGTFYEAAPASAAR
ncbi:MAG TPA: ABC transporter substrate-binding protein [Methylosinus sp.]|uniref:ABC transporter substrate-binding protein n=1 Tax=Methylosinus sp. TaxID=427 RepID=UPI002F92A769